MSRSPKHLPSLQEPLGSPPRAANDAAAKAQYCAKLLYHTLNVEPVDRRPVFLPMISSHNSWRRSECRMCRLSDGTQSFTVVPMQGPTKRRRRSSRSKTPIATPTDPRVITRITFVSAIEAIDRRSLRDGFSDLAISPLKIQPFSLWHTN